MRTLLNDPANPDVVHRLIAPDATYVSLDFDNPELQRHAPGRHAHRPHDTFGTASALRSGGAATCRSDPDGSKAAP